MPESDPTGSQSEPALPVIDQNTYDTLADAIGPVAMTELLARVNLDIQAARDRLGAALDPLDLSAIRSVTHILISVADAVGALSVQERARQINAACHQNDAATMEHDFPGLLNEIDRALEYVRKQIGG